MSLCVRLSMKAFQRLLVSAPVAALLPVALAPVSGLASEFNLNLDSVQEYSLAQGASIRDFSDVYPTDWAYQALAELVETYGCVGGYPDGTFRGNQPITRFEMASLLSKCMNAMSAKMDMMSENMGAMEDMETLERLVSSFEEELITLKGSVDGLDAKVSELEDSQFSTTTKASFEIVTDFIYFASDDPAARTGSQTPGTTIYENSGIALSSEVEVGFETSFTGSDKLSFSLTGDLLSKGEDYYLTSSDFYDAAGDEGSAAFSGFSYETTLDLGGMMTTLVFGTDVDDLDPVVGLDTYYGGSGYDGYGPGDFGDAGIGFNVELLSSDAGTLTASAAYAVEDGDDGDVSNEMGSMGIFGEETDRSGVLALSWDGALFGGNDALFTVAYQNIKENSENDLTKGYLHLVAGAYFTDAISLSGSFSFGTHDYQMGPDMDVAQWMVGLNMDDAFFPGNSAGIAYGTPEFVSDPETDNVMKVLEIYYTFKVNDHFEVPVYLDFISNVNHMPNADAWGVAVRPTLTF